MCIPKKRGTNWNKVKAFFFSVKDYIYIFFFNKQSSYLEKLRERTLFGITWLNYDHEKGEFYFLYIVWNFSFYTQFLRVKYSFLWISERRVNVVERVEILRIIYQEKSLFIPCRAFLLFLQAELKKILYCGWFWKWSSIKK